jgi:hypothetical protein
MRADGEMPARKIARLSRVVELRSFLLSNF